MVTLLIKVLIGVLILVLSVSSIRNWYDMDDDELKKHLDNINKDKLI